MPRLRAPARRSNDDYEENAELTLIGRPVNSAFPGRWLGGASLCLGPLLLLSGVLLRLPFDFFFPQQLAAYEQHPLRMDLAYTLFILGNILLWPAVLVLVQLIAETSYLWALWGGSLTMFGLFARTFSAGVDHLAFQLVRVEGLAPATKAIADSYGAFHIFLIVALAKIPEDMDVDPSVAAALRQAADHLERSGYRVSEVEVPDINGVWQTWCDIITNETVVMQEAGMLKVTSEDFHKAWGGMKAKANMLDLKGWMQATAARNGHIRAWQLFFEEYPVVLAPTTVKPTPGPREDTVSAERVREIFWGEIRFISAINVLGLPGAVVPVTLHDGKPIGVQLIAGRYREDLALDAAAAIEKRAGVLSHRLWETMG